MVSPTTIKALARELSQLQRRPADGIRVSLSNEADLLSFSGWIQGPPETPYAGGFFRITFNFNNIDFPNVPPTCRFATPIFHPNVSRSGEICVSSLKKDWKREYGIERILVTIKCLLIEPNPDSALDAEASRLMQEDWERYADTAKLWTSVHANKKPACFEHEAQDQATPSTTKLKPSHLAATATAAAATPLASCSATRLTTTTSNATASLKTRPIPTATATATSTTTTAAPRRGLRRL